MKHPVWLSLFLFSTTLSPQQGDLTKLAGPYLGPKPPGMTPKDVGFGNWDLYASFRDAAGNWGALVNLGSVINTEAAEAGASFSPEGKLLFFSRAGDIFWVSANIVEGVK